MHGQLKVKSKFLSRVVAKDCIPDPLSVTNVSVFVSEPAELLPPHCTRKFTIKVPDVITAYSGAVTCSGWLSFCQSPTEEKYLQILLSSFAIRR